MYDFGAIALPGCSAIVKTWICMRKVKFPNMGRSYDRIKPGLRGVPLDGYIIFYRVVDNGIEILRVVSGYQELEAMFPDETRSLGRLNTKAIATAQV